MVFEIQEHSKLESCLLEFKKVKKKNTVSSPKAKANELIIR